MATLTHRYPNEEAKDHTSDVLKTSDVYVQHTPVTK
jgi:hypothetical protein